MALPVAYPLRRDQRLQGTARARDRLVDRWVTLVVGICAAGPVIAATARALVDGWMPAGDQAIIATRAYDVFTSRTPLVGQHSDASTVTHDVVNSLGPMLYWLLALPARLGSPGTLTLTIGLANTLAIVGVVALARRRGGLVLMFATAVAVVLMCRSLAPEVLHDVWNPSAALLPFTLLIFLCWSLACGEYRLLPVTVVVASFVVQCQLAYLLPSLGLLVVGLVGLIWSRVSLRAGPETNVTERRRDVRWWALAALLLALVCWTPPVIDQLDRQPGNLTAIVRAAGAQQTRLGVRTGWRAVVRAIGVPPWWLSNPAWPWKRKVDVRVAASTLATVSGLLMLCALVTVAVVGLLRRRADLCAGALIALATCGGLAAVASVTPATHLLAGTLAYTMWWGSPAGMFVWLILGWSLAAMLANRDLPRTRVPVYASLGAGVGAVAVTAAAVAVAQRPDYHLREYAPLGAMYAALDRGIPAARTVRLVGTLGNVTFRFKMAARFALVRRGIRPLSPGTNVRLGSWYELDHQPYDCTVYVEDGHAAPAGGGKVLVQVSYRHRAQSYPVTVRVSSRGFTRERAMRSTCPRRANGR